MGRSMRKSPFILGNMNQWFPDFWISKTNNIFHEHFGNIGRIYKFYLLNESILKCYHNNVKKDILSSKKLEGHNLKIEDRYYIESFQLYETFTTLSLFFLILVQICQTLSKTGKVFQTHFCDCIFYSIKTFFFLPLSHPR